MSAPDRASLRSPLRSPASILSAVRARVRRHRLARVAIIVVVGSLAVVRVGDAVDAATSARDRWAPTATAWVVTVDLGAGSVLEPDQVTSVAAPPGLMPDDAVTADPTGQRVRVDHHVGEILVTHRLADGGSVHGARTPPGTVAVALDRTSDLFSVGDRVDLHDQVDGARLAAEGVVIAVTEGDVAVAVDVATIDGVVRGLGRGGVVPVLRSG